MLAAIVITALAVMYLSKCAKCGRMAKELDYMREENLDLRQMIFGKRRGPVDPIDYNYDDTKWYEIK